MKKYQKIAAVGVALLLVLSGCGQNPVWVYEYNAEQLPAGVYIAYQISALAQVENQVLTARYMEGNYEELALKDLLAQTYEEQLVADWVANKAQEQAKMYYAVHQQAEQRGIALTAEEQSAISASVNNLWATSQKLYEKNGISKDSLYKIQEASALQDALFLALYGEEGETPVTEQEIEAYFAENYAKAEYIALPKTAADNQETGETAAQINAQLLASAEAMRERLAAGDAVELVYYAHELSQAGASAEEIAAALAAVAGNEQEQAAADTEEQETAPDQEDSEEPETAEEQETVDTEEQEAVPDQEPAEQEPAEQEEPEAAEQEEAASEEETASEEDGADYSEIALREHDSYVITVGNQDQAYYQDGFVDAIVGAEIGTVALLETDSYIFIVHRLEPLDGGLPYALEALRSDMKAEEFEAWLAGLVQEMDIKVNSDAISTYTPGKLDFDEE